jgi:hypothetical protein
MYQFSVHPNYHSSIPVFLSMLAINIQVNCDFDKGEMKVFLPRWPLLDMRLGSYVVKEKEECAHVHK